MLAKSFAAIWSTVRTSTRMLGLMLLIFFRILRYFLLPFVWFSAICSIGLLFLIFMVPTTTRDVSYRNIDPASDVCKFASDQAWAVLAAPSIDNSEEAAIAQRPGEAWQKKFACSVQRHTVPADNGKKSINYNLAFIEFKEDGSPYELIKDLEVPYSLNELSVRADRKSRGAITQLHAVTAQLRSNPGRNYVIAFVHGWRHDASIGDDNVADLRRYAAHAARFIQDRCDAGESDQCNRVVTAVYIGWRGARIDEKRIVQPFVKLGIWLDSANTRCRDKQADSKHCWERTLWKWGTKLSSVASALTLFDRKPVSEAIAPHVLTALRSIESTFDVLPANASVVVPNSKLTNPNRLLVIGHSLGGNLLATALERDLIKRVEWQARRMDALLSRDGSLVSAGANDRAKQASGYFDAPLGNLVVLINPASEARKWTSIQRAVWEKIVFRQEEEKTDAELERGHRLFPSYQRPVMISVTSAFAWPPGGIRVEDCAVAFGFDKALEAQPHESRERFRHEHSLEAGLSEAIAVADAKSRLGGVVYDTATHDLFPFFKLDFRPMADRIERYGRSLGGRLIPKLSCDKDTEITAWWPWLIVKVAAVLRDAPFQLSDVEETRTIGHLDAPRHASGSLVDYLLPYRPFGTTHEIRGLRKREKPLEYRTLASRTDLSCPNSDHWLSRARRQKEADRGHGTNWNSQELAAPTPAENSKASRISVAISHGFEFAGMNPITRANDPFWNMRAYDDVIAEHSGFLLSSFICALNQLVMDESTRIPFIPEVAEPPGSAAQPAIALPIRQ